MHSIRRCWRHVPPDDPPDEANSPGSGTTPGDAVMERRGGTIGMCLRRGPGRPRAAMPVGELQTRELILRQARKLFLKRGFADVAVGEIASAVGVTKPTLYYHFTGKESL